MNFDGNSKIVIALSVLALIVSIGSIAFCIMESNDDGGYDGIRYTLYIGLNEMDPDDNGIENDVKALLHNEKQGYTLCEGEGGYDMGDTYIAEKTLMFIINDCDEKLIHDIVVLVKEKYNIGVMVDKQLVKSDVYM